MSDANLVDARDLSCPEPVLLTLEAMKTYGKNAFVVAVSSATARDNVELTLQGEKRRFVTNEDNDGWRIEVTAE